MRYLTNQKVGGEQTPLSAHGEASPPMAASAETCSQLTRSVKGRFMTFRGFNPTDSRLGKAYYLKINRLRGRETSYGFSDRRGHFDERSSSTLLRSLIEAGKPLMVARYGSTELGCVLDYLQRQSISNWIAFLTGTRRWVGQRASTPRDMEVLSGFFPASADSLRKFARQILADSALVDVLGTWMLEEKFVAHLHPAANLVPLRLLEPFWSEVPWTSALAGKRVLVIHPFAETIEAQYRQREKLFSDSRILPSFD